MSDIGEGCKVSPIPRPETRENSRNKTEHKSPGPTIVKVMCIKWIYMEVR
jgi:hypothetical protein